MKCRCNYSCDCPPMDIGDDVRFIGGKDVYEVVGFAKTQPKAIIEVNGEAVYVPYECLEVVSSGDRQMLDLVRAELDRICKDAPRDRGTSRRYVEVSELYTLRSKIR